MDAEGSVMVLRWVGVELGRAHLFHGGAGNACVRIFAGVSPLGFLPRMAQRARDPVMHEALSAGSHLGGIAGVHVR